MKLGTEVVKEAETALDYLSDRREFWSQQKPEYETGGQKIGRRSISAQRRDSAGSLKERNNRTN